MLNKQKPVALIVLDGWGYREEIEFNPIMAAKKPFFDSIWQKWPHALLEASGEAVGLPDGQMGNSEVGHMTMGAGKVIDTDLLRISKAASNGDFEKTSAFTELFKHVKKYNSLLHVKGLLSPGGIHSHSEHLYAFLRAAKKAGVEKIAIHAFLDGRDVAPQSAHDYLKELEKVIAELGVGFIATASGRFYAMDRDNNWDRLAKAEDAIFRAKADRRYAGKPSELIRELHSQGILDEHLEPVVFLDENGKSYELKDNDGVFFFNFRSDRAKMLSKKIKEQAKERNLFFVTMTEYDRDLDLVVAFPPAQLETVLAAEISLNNLIQVHIAETEKFAHATYFLNGGSGEPHVGEEHCLIPSRKDVKTHDLAPKMKAAEITDKALEYLDKGVDFMFINYANPDMVGHTGNFDAVVEAIEEVDKQLKRVVEKILSLNGMVLITADHGNAEFSFDKFTNQKHTAHTTSPVPAILVGCEGKMKDGDLADVAPTLLHLLNIAKPNTMTGINLLVE